jgi:hypothetical protein
MRADITHLFAKEVILGRPVTRVIPTVVGSNVVVHTHSTDVVRQQKAASYVGVDAYAYSMPNYPGLCGIPYFQNTREGTRIAYIHGAGDEAQAVSGLHIITYQDVMDVKTAVQSKHTDLTDPVNMTQQSCFDGRSRDFPVLSLPQPYCPGVQHEGSFPPGISLYQPDDVCIVPTTLNPEFHPRGVISDDQGPLVLPSLTDSYEYFKSSRIPCVLDPALGGGLDMPLSKYGTIKALPNVTPPIPRELLRPMPPEHLLHDDFKPANCTMINLEESIRGCEGFPSLPLSHSSGYSRANRGINRATALFDESGNIRKDFSASVNRLIHDLYLQAVPMPTMARLKAELLPREDVLKGKVRLIHMGMLEYTIVGRMLFGMSLKELQRCSYSAYIAIGIDPHGPSWAMLYHRLKAISLNSLCGDFSGHEFTLPSVFLWQYMLWWDTVFPLPPFWARVRRHYLYSVLQPIVCLLRRAFKLGKGQGSGNELTQHYSSFCTHYFHLLAWRALGLSDEDFLKYVAGCTLGDDCLYTVSPKFPSYNMNYLASFARRLGMHYTTWSKTDVSADYANLHDIEFLKRGFRCFGIYVLAPLRFTSILESLMWEDKNASNDDRLSTYRSALIECRHYGRDTYELIRAIILRHAASYGLAAVLLPYESNFQLIKDAYGA